jgi:hypothetical protein
MRSIEVLSEKGYQTSIVFALRHLERGVKKAEPADGSCKVEVKSCKIITMESLILAQDER